MFPPETSYDPMIWVDGLWRSLSRAGNHFGQDALIEKTERGATRIMIPLKAALPPGAAKPILGYVREYARACGWQIEKTSLQKHYLLFIASIAKSKVSRNLSTRPSGSRPAKP
jgi:hypothetical protein